ncbi:XRE family transcriptional regulator [Paenibacillus lutimineralis]|uniref:XRE family transcriptional regulator n=1 Tax=Paenibacillus lutimineralis TaxID=2707005 RepID=A0A3S9V4C2_9BACL|nr:XRE family transcriptional regulator [Paenibacillus lutimineralis]AZS17414.1 XRE family transcriptional regulator [Paenibacillus lutimineralis]
MYPNLVVEMGRKGLKRKDLAWMFKNRPATVSDKLNGKSPILIDEAMRIKDYYFPEFPLDYLFRQGGQTDEQ